MADIALMAPVPLPENWEIVAKTENLQIAFTQSAGQYDVESRQFGSVRVVVLSHVVSCEDVYLAMKRYGVRFPEVLRQKGVVSGIVWNVKTAEYLVFRDIFGTIPWMVADENGQPVCMTTSPELHESLVKQRKYRRLWMALFLWDANSTSHEDVYEETRRILPGEMWMYHAPGRDFIALDGDIDEDMPKCWTLSGYWTCRKYQVMDASYQDVVHGLYDHLMDAASRIPGKKLCFTLSGGLDSTGVAAAWCRIHPGHTIDTCSLVSHCHRTCDESEEMDILGKAFPMRQIRVNMDGFTALSHPELYWGCRAYGPLCSPGMEAFLECYGQVEKQYGRRMIITGGGGNYIVNIRPETLYRYLFTHLKSGHVRSSILSELRAISLNGFRKLLGRKLGNFGSGELKRLYHGVFRNRRSELEFNDVGKWLNPLFAAQFPGDLTDIISEMTNSEERAWIPQSWMWEERMRALDWLARQTNHSFYDALLDPILYDYCAQIPPQIMLSRGEYRRCYKDALRSLLPVEIIHHPKVQVFDDSIHDGLGIMGKKYVEACLQQSKSETEVNSILDLDALMSDYRLYTEKLAYFRTRMNLIKMWRPLSLCLWNSGRSCVSV